MIRVAFSVVLGMVSIALPARAAPGLEIFFIDVEGGAATLIVAPDRDSLLVDSGNPGVRDAERIHRVARDVAGIERIGHYVTTHWHADHYGGIGRLAELMPVERFYDRGIPERLAEDPQYFPFMIGNYRKASQGRRTELKPGDRIAFRAADGPALEIVCLTAARRVLEADASAPRNECCGKHEPRPRDDSDNAMSVSLLVRYGKFAFLDCGDLTWNVEYDLVCPKDPIGKVDVFQVTHHGLESSNNPVLVDTIEPRVAIYNNGSRKGAAPRVTRTLRNVTGLQAIYQLHRNLDVDADLNTNPAFIANPQADCQAEFIRLSVAPDARSYSVRIGAGGAKTVYRTRE